VGRKEREARKKARAHPRPKRSGAELAGLREEETDERRAPFPEKILQTVRGGYHGLRVEKDLHEGEQVRNGVSAQRESMEREGGVVVREKAACRESTCERMERRRYIHEGKTAKAR